MRVLIIGNQIVDQVYLANYLIENLYSVTYLTSGLSAVHCVAVEKFDAVITCDKPYGISGIDLCREIVSSKPIRPSVIITGKGISLKDRVLAFHVGADDVVDYPYAESEVIARLEAIVFRRMNRNRRVLRVADLCYDLDTLQVTFEGRLLHITPINLRILEILMLKSPKLVKRQELEYYLWKDGIPHSDSLRSNIHILRRELGKNLGCPSILTIRGHGFRMSP